MNAKLLTGRSGFLIVKIFIIRFNCMIRMAQKLFHFLLIYLSGGIAFLTYNKKFFLIGKNSFIHSCNIMTDFRNVLGSLCSAVFTALDSHSQYFLFDFACVKNKHEVYILCKAANFPLYYQVYWTIKLKVGIIGQYQKVKPVGISKLIFE